MNELDEKRLGAADGLVCERGVRCASSSPGNLCRAKYIGFERFLQCLEEGQSCAFKLRLGRRLYLCQCPLRIHLGEQERAAKGAGHESRSEGPPYQGAPPLN
jgi:hypothetical protein